MCKHNWQPLFKRPAQSDTIGRMDYMIQVRDDSDTMTCTECGAVGYPSRGYSKGGTHKFKIANAQTAEAIKARAEEWNTTHA